MESREGVGGRRGGGWGQAFSPPFPPNPAPGSAPASFVGRSPRPQAERGRRLGGRPGRFPGPCSAHGAPSGPHRRLLLRCCCCCCCCWFRSSSAPRPQAGRRPLTTLRKVHPSPATSGPPPPHSPFADLHYYPVRHNIVAWQPSLGPTLLLLLPFYQPTLLPSTLFSLPHITLGHLSVTLRYVPSSTPFLVSHYYPSSALSLVLCFCPDGLIRPPSHLTLIQLKYPPLAFLTQLTHRSHPFTIS